jgi:hypothetical protein
MTKASQSDDICTRIALGKRIIEMGKNHGMPIKYSHINL